MHSTLKLRGQALGLLSMLAVQFILGMILNLFVQLPKTHPGISGGYLSRSIHGFGWAITIGGGIALFLHVIVAIGLLLGSFSLLVRAAAAKSGSWLLTSIIGALGVLAALTNGLAFLGYNSDVNSFVMAVGFIVAAVSYTTALSFVANPALISEAKAEDAEHHTHGFFGRFRTSHG
jgi:hypothetical protein